MVKMVFLLALTTLSLSSIAQLTISNNDMPSVNDIYHISITANLQGNNPALTGTNFLWDYSLLQASIQRSDTFVTVSSTPLAYQYYFNNAFLYPNHKADLAIKGEDIGAQPVVNITDVYDFYKNSSNKYANVGFGSNINGIPSSTRREPIDEEYLFPLNYNDNKISFSRFSISQPSGDGYGQYQRRIDTVDGWGTVITPLGTYNCIRVKSIVDINDSVYMSQFGITIVAGRPQKTEYKWLAASSGIPVLKISIDSVTTQIEYQDNLMVDINDNALPIYHLKVFPIPAKETIIIEFESLKKEQVSISLKDINGKHIKEIYSGDIEKGNNHILLSLSEFSNSFYFLDMNFNDYTITKKIVVSR